MVRLKDRVGRWPSIDTAGTCTLWICRGVRGPRLPGARPSSPRGGPPVFPSVFPSGSPFGGLFGGPSAPSGD